MQSKTAETIKGGVIATTVMTFDDDGGADDGHA